MSRRFVRRLTLWLTLGLVILGCATPALVTPAPVVADPGSLGTFIVQTAQAAQTQTALVASSTPTPSPIPTPTRTFTITPSPTATILFLIATNTSIPTGIFADQVGPTTGGSGNGPRDTGNTGDGFVKPTATPMQWTCRVLSKSPARGAVIPAGSSFTAVWTVQNTGTSAWPKKGVDVVYVSGARLNHGKPYYDIPAAVGTGGTVRISVTMEVPKRPKEYSTRWSLMVGKTQFCDVQFVFEAR